mmetsp:Transcript_37790/g.89728  ORF Transcript_37790/g.89728 Transcript_37790/m.89728 type:complete len:143 (-) Transcript_37790:594-1022(-)
MVHIDSEKLQSELNSVQSEFDTWADGLEAGLQNLSREYKDKIQEGTARISVLRQERDEVQQQAAALREKLSAEHSECEALQNELEAIHLQETALPKRLRELRERVEGLRSALGREQQGFSGAPSFSGPGNRATAQTGCLLIG